MKLIDQINQQPQQTLWQQLEHENRVMLEVSGITDFMKPMMAHPDAEQNTIWFFADRSSDVFGQIHKPLAAKVCLANGRENFWADIQGEIEESHNTEAIAANWSAVTESWYDKGRLDPNLMLLAFHPQVAEISAVTDNPFRLGYETMRALIGDQDKPDVGVQKKILLN